MSTETKSLIPEYLNEDLIKDTLISEFKNDQISVEEFAIAPATSPGDNYMSDVFRIQVKFRY